MNDFQLQPGEKRLEEERNVLWRKSWLSRQLGTLVFTTQRLAFIVDKPPAFSAATLVANGMRDSVPVDIPRDALEAIERGKHDTLVVKTESERFQFVVDVFARWDARLREAMHDDKIALEHVLARLAPKEKPPPYR